MAYNIKQRLYSSKNYGADFYFEKANEQSEPLPPPDQSFLAQANLDLIEQVDGSPIVVL